MARAFLARRSSAVALALALALAACGGAAPGADGAPAAAASGVASGVAGSDHPFVSLPSIALPRAGSAADGGAAGDSNAPSGSVGASVPALPVTVSIAGRAVPILDAIWVDGAITAPRGQSPAQQHFTVVLLASQADFCNHLNDVGAAGYVILQLTNVAGGAVQAGSYTVVPRATVSAGSGTNLALSVFHAGNSDVSNQGSGTLSLTARTATTLQLGVAVTAVDGDAASTLSSANGAVTATVCPALADHFQ